MPTSLAEALTQLSFLEFLQRCNLLIAPPQRTQPPVPISPLDVAVQTASPCEVSQDASTQTPLPYCAYLTVMTTSRTHCHVVMQARALRVLEFFVHILCQHHRSLLLQLSLISDGRAAVCAAATWHHRVESFMLFGQLILSTTLCPTVTKWHDRHICAATCFHTGG